MTQTNHLLLLYTYRSNIAQRAQDAVGVISRLLYHCNLIYVNDVVNAVPEEKVKLFADDTNLFVAGSSLAAANSSANNLSLIHISEPTRPY